MRKRRTRRTSAVGPDGLRGEERRGVEPDNIRVYGNPRNTVPGCGNS
jgi:hypothetical protein